MHFTSGQDRVFERLMQEKPGFDHYDGGGANAPEDCGSCRFYRPDWKYTGRKIDKLLFVTQKIEKQDLDFQIENSGIFEVDRALFALEHLKQALKTSLTEQWQADKLRQDQISALAHDLKTPLTIIRGNTELPYDMALTDNQKECADYIEGSVVQMQDYVETLIDMTKTRESLSFHPQNVKLSSLLHEIHTQAKGLCAVKNIHLEWCENFNREYFLADSEQLIRAFANVLSNATEHTPAGKTVFFNMYEKDSFILCSITDTGNGFSPEALKRATEQFYMDEQSRHSKSHYGIGLYVANSIITQHGGQLILSNSEKNWQRTGCNQNSILTSRTTYNLRVVRFSNLYKIYKNSRRWGRVVQVLLSAVAAKGTAPCKTKKTAIKSCLPCGADKRT